MSARIARRVGLAAMLLFGAGTASQAQTTVGDSLWQLGRTDEARLAYERAIGDDRNAVRANFRLAQLLAWHSNVDSALVLLRSARHRLPDDPDLLFTEATYLSWAKRWPEALVRYDSIIAAHPDFDYVRNARARTLSWAGRLAEARAGYDEILRHAPADRDAGIGRAQVSAWSGDLNGAAQRYEALLADDPGDPRVLMGLASVRSWLGRPATALRLLDRAEARAKGDADVATVRKAVRESSAPSVDATQYYSDDTDGNVNRWRVANARAFAGNARGTFTAGTLEATDPRRDSRRIMLEGTVAAPVGIVMLTGALGVRQLSPSWRAPAGEPVTPDRSVITWRAGVSGTLAPRLTGSLTFSHWPFDEIASLLGGRLDITQEDASLEWRMASKGSVALGASHLAFSDHNARSGGTVRVTQPLAHGFSVGAFAIGFGYAEKKSLYFSPAAFRAAEATAGWSRETPAWSAGISGGYGRQRVTSGQPIQEQWHLDARAAVRLSATLRLELFGGRSTSAAASAVGAYRYDLLGLTLRYRRP